MTHSPQAHLSHADIPPNRQERPILTIDNVSLIRRGQVLLQSLSLNLPASETVAVMGRSGAGKTTLLNTIAGLAKPGTGSISRPPGRIPVVFQDPRLLPWRTIQQNVELVLEPAEIPRASQWLATVGLGDVANNFPLTLSGGMRQRVAIARALSCQAPLLLVDEPFAHLDLVTATALRHELRTQISATESAVVWVTHDPAEAAEVATRTLVMDGPPNGTATLVSHSDYATSGDVIDALTELLHRTTATHDSSTIDRTKIAP